MRFRRTLILGAFLCNAAGASAQVVIPLTVSGNQATGTISLGGIVADLTLGFESQVGLAPTSFNVTATLVNPLDPNLLARLPHTGWFPQLSIPAAFPVLLAIDPSSSSSLSFTGVATVNLHTPLLQLNTLLPFALFKAHDGGAFQDISVWEASGSYRVCGSEGDFSEFLIILDLRPIDTVISGKFDDAQGLVDQYSSSLTPDVVSLLQGDLAVARSDWQSGATNQAISDVSTFLSDVLAHSGTDIPNVWRANDSSVVDIAGLLRTAGGTLNFSLERKSNR